MLSKSDQMPVHANCAHCGCCEQAGESPRETPPLKGWRFTAAAAGVFLVPVVGALCGALIAGQGHSAGFIGGSVGFLCGMALSIGLSKTVLRNKETNP